MLPRMLPVVLLAMVSTACCNPVHMNLHPRAQHLPISRAPAASTTEIAFVGEPDATSAATAPAMSTAEPVTTTVTSEGPLSPSAAPVSSRPVEEVFASRFVADFSDATAGGNAQEYIPPRGFQIATWGANKSPYNVSYDADNVRLGDGEVLMTVSAHNGSGPVHGAQLKSNFHFMFASMRVQLRSTAVPGIVIGHFFYKSDLQETDIEILTKTITIASDTVGEGIWFTNQATAQGQKKSNILLPLDFDPSVDYHEYRIDWLPTYTAFFIDGVERGRLTDNIPTAMGPYVLNGWSSGDPYWSAGPPTEDATFAVRRVEIYHQYLG